MNVKAMNANDFEKIEKAAKEKARARNTAYAYIDDALARYIKKKTRARSKKAAVEKDAAINSPRFRKIAEYDRREDILEAYGCGIITESEADRLEDLWDEREHLKEMSVDGVYSDMVTECIEQAKNFVMGLFEDEIGDYEVTKIAWEKKQEKDEEERARMHEDYKAWKNGWGKYYRGNIDDINK